jgi:hypothetical protein
MSTVVCLRNLFFVKTWCYLAEDGVKKEPQLNKQITYEQNQGANYYGHNYTAST